jgi:CRP-like cAMP-binding protein
MDPIWDNIFRKKLDEDSLAYFLKSQPTFAELTARELAMLEELVHVRSYKTDEIVFEEGDPGSGMYMIRSGIVSIYDQDPRHQDDELARLSAGDFFGETTLTAPAPRSVSARTLENTELVGLFRADLLEVAEKQPMLASRILFGLTRVVSERLQAASLEIRRLQTTLGEHVSPENIET